MPASSYRTESYSRPAPSYSLRDELAALPQWAIIAGGGLGAALMGMLLGAALAV